MEKKRKVTTYEVDYICDCGGKMRPTGQCFLTDPPQYPHRCNKCGDIKTFNVTYPFIEYDE